MHHCLKKQPLRQKCPNTEFFMTAYSCIPTEFGDLLRKPPYSVRKQENTDQKNSVFGYFLRSDQVEAISRFGNYFYLECFLQYFEGCARVLNVQTSWTKKQVTSSSLDVIPTTTNWIKSILKIMPKFVFSQVTKEPP